jgi:hypothetical protein
MMVLAPMVDFPDAPVLLVPKWDDSVFAVMLVGPGQLSV